MTVGGNDDRGGSGFRRNDEKKYSASSGLAGLLGAVAEDALFLAVPVAAFGGFALVAELFAHCQGELGLDQVAFPVQRNADAGLPLLLGGGDDFRQFLLVQQQFSEAVGVRVPVAGGGIQWE